MVALDWQSLARSWRRFWSSRLVEQADVKGRHFTPSFKIYQSDDGEQTCRMSFYSAGDPKEGLHLADRAQGPYSIGKSWSCVLVA